MLSTNQNYWHGGFRLVEAIFMRGAAFNNIIIINVDLYSALSSKKLLIW